MKEKDGQLQQLREQLAATKEEASHLEIETFEQERRRPRRLLHVLMKVGITPPGEKVTGLSEEEQARYEKFLAGRNSTDGPQSP